MSNAEQGIAQTRLEADRSSLERAESLQDRHDSGISCLNERVFLYLGIIAFLGLLVVWATASSPLVLYGSLALAILITCQWGWLRLKRIQSIDAARARQVAAMQGATDPDLAARPQHKNALP